MGYNYIKYNELGLLVDSYLTPISKGNNYVDVFYFEFENRDFTNAYLTFTATLPNGNTLPSATTTPTTFNRGANNVNGYMMKLSNAYTSQAGTMTFTLSLKDNKTNMTLCSAQLTINIADTDISVPTTIQESEKDQIQRAITDAVRDLNNRKVEVDFNLYGDADENHQLNGDIVISHFQNAYKFPAKKVINKVDSVNGETGDVVLSSNDIPHGENSNVGLELENKPNREDVCYFRDGELIPTELKAKGFLNYTTNDIGNGVEIVLDDAEFENGDLVSFSMDFDVEGGSGTWNFLQLLTGNFTIYGMVERTGLSAAKVSVNGIYRGNVLTLTSDNFNRAFRISVFRW